MSVVTIQPTTGDGYLYQRPSYNTICYGTDTVIYVNSEYAQGENRNQRIVGKFDLSAIPSGAVISSAVLSLYAQAGSTAGRTLGCYRVIQTNWVEGTSPQTSNLSWDHYSGTTHWATGGGDYTATDKATATSVLTNNWVDWQVAAQAQYALGNVSGILHFLIKDETEGGAGVFSAFASREYSTDTTKRPKLVITYTVPITTASQIGSITRGNMKSRSGTLFGSVKNIDGLG